MPVYNLYREGQVWRNTLRPEQWFLVLDTEGELIHISESDKQTKWLHRSLLGDCYELIKAAD
jgi:hypothetical protein